MIMGADYFESEEQRAATAAAGGVPLGIGEGSIISNAIIDKNARIGKVRAAPRVAAFWWLQTLFVGGIADRRCNVLQLPSCVAAECAHHQQGRH
jgi:hypothetical protein